MKNRKYLDLKNKYFYNTLKGQNVTSLDHYKIILGATQDSFHLCSTA